MADTGNGGAFSRVAKADLAKLAPLFDGWDETLLWSCLQGCMGDAWADDPQNPRSAQIVTGDFCFFAGQPHSALVGHIPAGFPSPCILMIPQTPAWARLLEEIHEAHCERFTRYAFKKQPSAFDTEALRRNVEALPPAYTLRRIDAALYPRILATDWAKDLCSQFPTCADYEKRGIGFAAFCGEELVCGASSYTVYRGGIEIEIDTSPAFRRRGLALVCASALITACLERGLYPSWDAANSASAALAERLGYQFDYAYDAYAVAASP